jgi:hypothetical protein
VKCGSIWLTVLRPKQAFVAFDDGATDGQSHAHSVRLGRKEGFENGIQVARMYSWAAVLDYDSYAVVRDA